MTTNQFRDARARSLAGQTWVCPRCDHPSVEYPALSRRDNVTPVCSRCSHEEALRQMSRLEPWPHVGVWPFMDEPVARPVRR